MHPTFTENPALTVALALAARLALGWDWTPALLFGTLVIVTGPTVVTPLLRRIKVRRNLETILESEGVLIDAVGAVVGSTRRTKARPARIEAGPGASPINDAGRAVRAGSYTPTCAVVERTSSTRSAPGLGAESRRWNLAGMILISSGLSSRVEHRPHPGSAEPLFGTSGKS